MTKRKFKKCLALVCAVSVLFGGTNYSAKAEETVNELSTKEVASTSYKSIVTKYTGSLSSYKTTNSKLVNAGLTDAYNTLCTKLGTFETMLTDNQEDCDYDEIKKAYDYGTTTVASELSTFSSSVSAELQKVQSGSAEYNNIVSLQTNTNNFKTTVNENVLDTLESFLDEYANNKQYSDKLSIIIDLEGGTYVGNNKVTLEGYAGTKIALHTPQKLGHIFKGWEVVTGDCTIANVGSSYEITFNSTDGLIKPIWEYDGVTVIETPSVTETPITPTPEVTEVPTVKTVSVQVALNGGTYLGEENISKKVAEGSSTVLVDNVYLIKKKGYYIDSFTCEYGSCKITPDGKVVYTAPMTSKSSIDAVKVNWEETSEITDQSSNTIYLDLGDGVYTPTGQHELAFRRAVGSVETLVKVSDLTLEGYEVGGVECENENVVSSVQDGNIIVKTTDFEKDGVELKVIWVEKVEVTTAPAVEATTEPTEEPISESSTEPIIEVTAEPITEPVVEITTEPTQVVTVTEVPAITNPPVITEVPVLAPTASPVVSPTVKPTVAPTDTGNIQTEPVATQKPDEVDFKVNFYSTTIGAGENIKVVCTVKVNGNKEEVSFTSADETIATVTEDGVIKGVAAGSTQVVIKFGNYSRIVNVIVKLKPARISFSKKMSKKVTYSLKVGKTKKLGVWFDKGSYSHKVTLKSSNKKVATVTDNGIIKAKKKGTCKISAKTYNGKTCYAIIKVK